MHVRLYKSSTFLVVLASAQIGLPRRGRTYVQPFPEGDGLDLFPSPSVLRVRASLRGTVARTCAPKVREGDAQHFLNFLKAVALQKATLFVTRQLLESTARADSLLFVRVL